MHKIVKLTKLFLNFLRPDTSDRLVAWRSW